jgi:hypothetical protein
LFAKEETKLGWCQFFAKKLNETQLVGVSSLQKSPNWVGAAICHGVVQHSSPTKEE